MATGKALDGNPHAGNPHVWFDEGEVASVATPRRGSLLYKKRSCLKGVAAVCLVLLADVATAETRAWWHFDEADAGTIAAANSVADECSPTIYGEVFSCVGTVANPSGDYLPRYARPFRGLEVYDPVTGISRTNRSSMEFRTASGEGKQAYYGGALRFALPSDGYATGDRKKLTVELFMCTTGTVASLFSPLICNVMLNGSGVPSFTGERWAVYYQRDIGRIGLRYKATAYYGYSSTKAVNDGLWHHVAITYDGTTIKLYVDYNLEKTLTASPNGQNLYDASDRIYIGGYTTYSDTNGHRRYNGYIDEIRISDDVLTPDQFLRLRPMNPSSDPDEVVRIRFTPFVDSGATPQYAESMTENFDLQGTFCAQPNAEGATVYDTSAKAGTRMGGDLFDDSPEANTAALCQTTNAAGKANYIKVPNVANALGLDELNVTRTNLNYTIEAFFKIRRSARGQTLFKLGITSQVQGHVFFERSTDTLLFCYTKYVNGSGSWASMGVSPGNLLNGDWHHVAFVSDATNRTIRAYYDYMLYSTVTNVDCFVSNGSALSVGANETPDQFFDGWIDDCRVTRRALRPEEFLTTHPVGSVSPRPLLLARYENDYKLELLTDDTFAIVGTGEARTGGNAPTFVNSSPGTLMLDGTNGNVLAKNAHSVHVDKSRIVYPGNYLFDVFGTNTVELVARFTGFAEGGPDIIDASNQHAGFLRLTRSTSTAYDWYVYRRGDRSNEVGIAVRHQEDTSKVDYPTWSLPNVVADGRWHHYAFTFEPYEEDGATKTRIVFFHDYERIGSYTMAGTVNLKDVPFGHRLMVCESTGTILNFQGEVNALRLSRGVLPPEAFMRFLPIGTMILIR